MTFITKARGTDLPVDYGWFLPCLSPGLGDSFLPPPEILAEEQTQQAIGLTCWGSSHHPSSAFDVDSDKSLRTSRQMMGFHLPLTYSRTGVKPFQLTVLTHPCRPAGTAC